LVLVKEEATCLKLALRSFVAKSAPQDDNFGFVMVNEEQPETHMQNRHVGHPASVIEKR